MTELTAAEAELLAVITAKPVVLKRMSDALRAPAGFHLGIATDMAKRGLITRTWDTKREAFVFAPNAEDGTR